MSSKLTLATDESRTASSFHNWKLEWDSELTGKLVK